MNKEGIDGCTCDELGESSCPRHEIENSLRERVSRLEEWKAGALAALTIAYPPTVGGHTEQVFCDHKERYTRGTESYREGADSVGRVVLYLKGF